MQTTAFSDSSDVVFFPADKPWVEETDGLRLIGGQCAACGARSFPRALYCNNCDAQEQPEPVRLSAQGTLYTFTTLHVGPAGFPAPRYCGYVDLDDEVRVFGQIAGEQISIGDRLGLELATVRTLPDGRSVVSFRFRKVD